MDLAAIKSRLADSNGRLYWRSLGQLADTPDFRDYLHREFPDQASEWNDPKGRRDFLKLMSASLALAGVGACTKQPPESIVPYVRQPEDIVPGRPLYFASAIPFSGTAMPVLVESHMGRPTKIEGNPEHPASLGGTDVLTQASVLNLYDPDRGQTITFRGEVRGWPAFVAAAQGALGGQKGRGGAGLHFLTPPITSPSMAEMLGGILRDYPSATWHQYDSVVRPTARSSQSTPIYHFDKADVIVSLDADFLSCGPGSVRYSKDFARRRRLTEENASMNRLYAIESSPTLTGAKADHRLTVRASDVERVARELASAVSGSGATGQPAGAPQPGAPDVARFVAAVAKDLSAHKGRALVVAGDYQTDGVHAAARALNDALGATGATVTYAASVEAMPAGAASSIAELTRAMDAGRVEVLVIMGGNPVFTAPVDLRFAERLAKVNLVIYQSTHPDETSLYAHWNVPELHALECWGDARSFDGTVTLVQPLIAPLYEGRSPHEFVCAFTSQPDRRGMAIVKDYWTKTYSSGAGGWTFKNPRGESFPNADAFWRSALHDGFLTGTSLTEGAPGTTLTPTSASAPAPRCGGRCRGGSSRRPCPQPETSAPPASTAPAPVQQAPSPAPAAAEGGLEIIFRPDPAIWDGRFANKRLAPGTAEAVHQDHLGPGGVDQHAARRGARPA
jgi:molybdopterin-containing oxidoreductase family iron-sulfur binding subunit